MSENIISNNNVTLPTSTADDGSPSLGQILGELQAAFIGPQLAAGLTDNRLPVDDPLAELGENQVRDWGSAEVERIVLQSPDGKDQGEILIPWFPTSKSTVFDPKTRQWTEEKKKPAFINNLDALLRNPQNVGVARSMKTAAAREIVIKTQPRINVQAIQGNIVLTSRLPWNVTVATDEFIYVSSHYVRKTGVKWDFDGDQLRLGLHPYEEEQTVVSGRWPNFEFKARHVVPIKNPITRAITPMLLLDSRVLGVMGGEPLFDFTQSEVDAWSAVSQELRLKELAARQPKVYTPGLPGMSESEYVFRKSHDLQSIGQLDGLVKNYTLHQWRTVSDLRQKQNGFYTNDVAFEVLENSALGAQRKDHAIGTDATALAVASVEANPFRLPTAYSPYLTRTGRVGSLKPSQVDWVWTMDLALHLARVRKLDIPVWGTVAKRQTQPPTQFRYEHTVIRALHDSQILQIEPLARDYHQDANIPPAVRVWLVRGADHVALTDVRKSQGVIPGLVWSFVLPPVFCVETGKWHAPLLHMERESWPVFEQQEDREPELVRGLYVPVNDVQSGEFNRWWLTTGQGKPWPQDLLKANPNQVNVNRLQEWLSGYIGRYGLVLPTTSPDLQIPEDNLMVARNAVVVDYGPGGFDQDRWWEAFSRLPKIVCPASKGDDQQVRKYALTAELGDVHPWWSPKDVNPRRAGQFLSQMSRAHQKQEMVVAICCPTPLTGNVLPNDWGEPNQVWITQHGIQQQLLSGELGETVFNDRIVHEPTKGFDEEREFMTLGGQRRRCWAKRAKRSKRIGKLIDGMGSKFMPAPIPDWAEAWYETWENVEQAPEPFATIQVQVGTNPQTGDPEYRSYVVSEHVDPQAERIAVLDSNGTPAFLPRAVCVKPIRQKVRHQIDLLYPVQELVDKGVYDHYMQGAEQRVVHLGNGQTVTCWVTVVRYWRTSGATENSETRMVETRVRGFDAHLVQAGARRAGIEFVTVREPLERKAEGWVDKEVGGWSIIAPNLDYAQAVKSGILRVLQAMGYDGSNPQLPNLLPPFTGLTIEQTMPAQQLPGGGHVVNSALG